jgi:polyisoprenoid-binding protein YceI
MWSLWSAIRYSWLLCPFLSVPCLAIGTEQIKLDSRCLDIGFEVTGAGFWRVRGRFEEAWGEIELNRQDPDRSRLKVVAKVASVRSTSTVAARELQSDRFFDVERHPFVKFESSAVTFSGPERGTVTGNLEIRGTSRPWQLAFRLISAEVQPPKLSSVGSLQAVGKLKRSQWGMTTLIPAVSDEVMLTIKSDCPLVLKEGYGNVLTH